MKMLNYYTQFLGLDGKIERQGMLLRQEKHELEDEVDILTSQRDINEKRITQLEGQLAQFKGQLEEVTTFLKESRSVMEGVGQQLTTAA